MAKDYKIYYLKDLSFDFIRKMNKDINQFLSEHDLKLSHVQEDSRDVVKVSIVKLESDGNAVPVMDCGCLSEEDGTEYIPYLKKKRADLYEVTIIKINTDFDDLDKAVMVAIRIAEKK